VTCPDWRSLVAARDAQPDADLPAWEDARRHAASCRRCRSAALAADPLLVFARLPERSVTAEQIGDMQAAVSALVRAGRVGQSAERASASRHGVTEGRSAVSRVSRFAAALGVCSLLALSGAPRRHAPVFGTLAAGQSARGEAAVEDGAPLDSALEELDRPGARIYELPQSDMAVVMIVDASLDV
jgi:hypothetical protein